MDIQKITTPYTDSAVSQKSPHSRWFVGVLSAGATMLLIVLGLYVYGQYNTPERQINRALERTSNIDPVPVSQEDIDRAMGRVTKTKPVILDQKAIDEAMSKTQR